MPKTVTEQIRDLQATRMAKAAAMETLTTKQMDEGRGFTEEEAEQFDNLDAEIKQIDNDLLRLERMAQILATRAAPVTVPVVRARQETDAANTRGPTIYIPTAQKEDKFKGQSYTRMLIAKALHKIDGEVPAWLIAQRRWGDSAKTVVDILRAAVAGGGTGSGEWGAELVQANGQFTGDFIEYLYSKTVYDQLPLRAVPPHVTIKGQDGQGTGYWVGESKAIPATALDFSNVTLTPLKVAALAVISNDLIRYSDPSAEMMVRDGIVQASSQRIDTTFISATAASSGVSPAGLLNGVSALTASGEDFESLMNDIKRLYDIFITAKNSTGLTYVMHPGLAKSISLMTGPLGQILFPDLGTAGGTLRGDPVVTGENVGTDDMILLKPSDIYKIGDTGVEVSVSKEATIEQDNAPTGATDTPVAQTAYPVSMFQEDSTAFRVIRHINFAKRRSGAVQYVGDATYNGQQT